MLKRVHPQQRDTRDAKERALKSTFRPIAIGQIFSSLEYLSQSDIYREDGYLRGLSAARATPGTFRQKIYKILDDHRSPRLIAAVNLAAAVALLLRPEHRRTQILAASTIAVCNRLNEIRSPYGRDGADQMTATITQYRLVSAFIPDAATSDDIFLRSVNIQAALSYYVSGLSKLFSSSWVQGDALGDVLITESYGQSKAALALRRFPLLNRILTWATVLGELAYPVVFILPQDKARYFLAGAKLFHAGIALVMELPRFFWGFSSAHASTMYVIEMRGENR